MSVESLECENLDVNEVSAAERDQVAGKHPDTLMFAWTMVGALVSRRPAAQKSTAHCQPSCENGPMVCEVVIW